MPQRANDRVIDAVASSPLFARCSRRELRELVRSGVETQVPAGWALVHEGTPADACYVIVEGVARVHNDGTVVAVLGRGDVVGEVALATARLRNATVVAETPLHLLRIDSGRFASLAPGLRASLLRDVAQRSNRSAAEPSAV